MTAVSRSDAICAGKDSNTNDTKAETKNSPILNSLQGELLSNNEGQKRC